MTYVARKTLPFKVEFIRQLRRRRTLVAFGLMVLLPLIVVAAVKFGSGDDDSSDFGGGKRYSDYSGDHRSRESRLVFDPYLFVDKICTGS